jgi:hypothetical protein
VTGAGITLKRGGDLHDNNNPAHTIPNRNGANRFFIFIPMLENISVLWFVPFGSPPHF